MHTDLVASNLLVLHRKPINGSRFVSIDPDRTALGAREFDIGQYAVRTNDPMKTLKAVHRRASSHLSPLGLLAATAIYARVDAGYFILPNNALLEDVPSGAYAARVKTLTTFLAQLEDSPCTQQARREFASLTAESPDMTTVEHRARAERATADNLLGLSDECERRALTGREDLEPVTTFNSNPTPTDMSGKLATATFTKPNSLAISR
jgi:hypothetical protein